MKKGASSLRRIGELPPPVKGWTAWAKANRFKYGAEVASIRGGLRRKMNKD